MIIATPDLTEFEGEVRDADVEFPLLVPDLRVPPPRPDVPSAHQERELAHTEGAVLW